MVALPIVAIEKIGPPSMVEGDREFERWAQEARVERQAWEKRGPNVAEASSTVGVGFNDEAPPGTAGACTPCRLPPTVPATERTLHCDNPNCGMGAKSQGTRTLAAWRGPLSPLRRVFVLLDNLLPVDYRTQGIP